MTSPLAFVVVGHLDHGKSSLVGRLLADTGALTEGRIEKTRRICQEQGKGFEYAFLLDALEAEQLQGVTIDVAEVRFTWQNRDFRIIDAPGHKEFIKNMLTGAAHADAALLLVDVKEGVQEQSRRHAYLLGFLGVKQVAVVASKMDLVDYAEAIFDRVRDDCSAVIRGLDIRPAAFIPVSATDGENVVTRSPRTPWYRGPSVLEVLEGFRPTAPADSPALRLPIQDVYKFDVRRIIAGRVESGRVSVGDEIQVWPSGHRARVSSLEGWPDTGTTRSTADAGETTGLTLDYPLFVQRGDVIGDPMHPPRESNFLAANVFWIGRSSLSLNHEYTLKLATMERIVEVFSIARVMNAATMEVERGRTHIDQNEAGEVVLKASRPFVFDVAADVPRMGRFVLVDGYDVVGGGVIQEAADLYRRPYRHGLPRSGRISLVRRAVTDADRAASYGHKSHVIWLTGVPGVGKSTIARYIEGELFSRQVKTFVLDGEHLRFGLSADLTFTDADRSEQARRAAEVARLFQLAGLVAIVALVSPFRTDRAYARALIGDQDFTLVHLQAPLEVLRQRDPHDLYARALRGEPVSVSGLNSPYESPDEGSFAFDTAAESVESVGDHILESVLARIR